VSEIRYPIPWNVVFSIGPNIWSGVPASVDRFSAGFTSRIRPEPLVLGLEHLPDSPRFVLAANHYQRPGLWIAHVASVLTQVVRRRYGPGDPPVRWIVTANWPPLLIGGRRIPSPGDWLLPRVARALCCYPVAFAGANPGFTAKTLHHMLRDVKTLDRPIGLFPEGAAATAGRISPPLPGVDRLLRQLAKRGWPLLPAGISEESRFVIRFGPLVAAEELLETRDPASLTMQRIEELLPKPTHSAPCYTKSK
jgi:1-acyl-sn-glycerol-3-phosphate acyltransferase